MFSGHFGRSLKGVETQYKMYAVAKAQQRNVEKKRKSNISKEAGEPSKD
jgi:hypothetical protein